MKLYIFSLVCSTAMHFGYSAIPEEKKNEILKKIEKSVYIIQNEGENTSLHPFLRTVKIKDTCTIVPEIFINIYAPNITFGKSQNQTYKISCFYACINCQFGFWIKNALYNLIKDSLLSRRTEIFNDELAVNKMENDEINKQINLIKLAGKGDRLVDILSTLIEIAPNLIVTNETIVLETLFTLKFKMNLNAQILRKQKKDDLILELLIMMSALQKFILTNCDEPELLPEDYTTTKDGLFGYPLNLSAMKRLSLFLGHIQHFNLESYPQCSTVQILLAGLVKNMNDNKNLYTHLNISVNSKGSGSVNLIDLILEIQNTSDIVKIYNSMKHITDSFMYLLHVFACDRLSQFPSINKTARSQMNDILSKLNFGMFPKDISVYFERFHSYMTSSDRVPHLKNNLSIHYKKVFDEFSMNFRVQNYKIEEFINDLMKYERDFTCFSDVYRIFQNHIGKNIITYRGIEDKIKKNQSPDDSSSDVQNKFHFVNKIYALSLKITSSINKAAEVPKERKNEKLRHIQVVCTEFDRKKK